MNSRTAFCATAALLALLPVVAGQPSVLSPEKFRPYVETFNREDEEVYRQEMPNERAWDFLRANIPWFECPDAEFERTYYFRWWTFRKHVRRTPDGYVITEFLPPVPWAGKHNAISCPAGHHFYEGRWLRESRPLDDYAVFWFRQGGEPRRYSFWAADALWARHLVTPNPALLVDLLPDLIRNYEAWEGDRYDAPVGLFWQDDGQDGMEVSNGGTGYRATLNSYQYGDALAIARIADLAGRAEVVGRFRAKADRLKTLVQSLLWDEESQFFKVAPRRNATAPATDRLALASARELHGFTPWYFLMPDPRHDVAWKQLMDPKGFFAPFGPTTAEQRHPGFKVAYEGHECQWNGPSWPYATSITLTALANLLNARDPGVVTSRDYFTLLRQYALSHRLQRPDGRTVPWIDENLNPFTGDWIARTLLMQRGKVIPERGKDYNHSTFCDLVISGLVGLRPRADGTAVVNPLLPADTWEYFCLDEVACQGRRLTILWDRTGARYGRGPGLRVLVDGKEAESRTDLGPLTIRLAK